MGTQKLLHRLRDEGHLPNVSPRLGELTRTNSEAILGARTFAGDADFTKGVAITSSFHPDDHTHIEPVRYGKGSNAMGLLTTALADGGRSEPPGHLAEGGGPPPRHDAAQPLDAEVVGADDHRSRHADPRQLHHLLHREGPAREAALDLEAGPRRAEPDLDPGRPRRGAPDRGPHQGLPRRRVERRLRHPDDRPLPRRRRHRRRTRHRRDRPVPPRRTATPASTSSTAPPSPPTSA